MPCYEPPIPWNHQTEAREVLDDLRDQIKAERERKNHLAELLCGLCHSLEDSGHSDLLVDPALKVWWEEHKAWDLKRKFAEEEVLREAARLKVHAQEIQEAFRRGNWITFRPKNCNGPWALLLEGLWDFENFEYQVGP